MDVPHSTIFQRNRFHAQLNETGKIFQTKLFLNYFDEECNFSAKEGIEWKL